MLLGNIAEWWKQVGRPAAPGLRLQEIPHECQLFRKLIVLDREVAGAGASEADNASPIVVDGDVLDREGGEHDDRTAAVLRLASFDNRAAEHPFGVANAAVEAPAAVDAIILPIAYRAAGGKERDCGGGGGV